MSHFGSSRRRLGLTRMEALVVLLFVCLGGGALASAVSRVRAAANRTQSMNNLHQLGIAIHNNGDAHAGKLPMGRANFFPPLLSGPAAEVDRACTTVAGATRTPSILLP